MTDEQHEKHLRAAAFYMSDAEKGAVLEMARAHWAAMQAPPPVAKYFIKGIEVTQEEFEYWQNSGQLPASWSPVYAQPVDPDPNFVLSPIGKLEPRRGYTAATPPGDGGCNHTWRTYVGFSATYDYCTVCDQKRK